MARIREEIIHHGMEDAFAVCDLASVRVQHARWNKELPMVRPFFAVKCCPDEHIIKQLHALGTGFDCASRGEIELVTRLGADTKDIIYANPCKQPSHIRFAAEQNVTMTTVDNADELRKLAKYHPTCGIVFRILPDDSSAVCRLGNKFGALVDDMPELLAIAKELNLSVVGVSFHCGSGCRDAMAYADAVYRARRVFDMAKALGMPELTLLDIGGGFPGAALGAEKKKGSITFEEIAAAVRPALLAHFPPSTGVTVISEPGRFFVDASSTIAASVIARRVVKHASEGSVSDHSNSDSEEASDSDDSTHGSLKQSINYYLNDGLYQSFNCIVFDHAVLKPEVLNLDDSNESRATKVYDSILFGPTCDGLDKLTPEHIKLPELEIGDWLVFPNAGAYTKAAASAFNGIQPPKVFYINESSPVC